MTGSFTILPDHPSLPGHFPGHPIVPGVVLLDHVAALLGPVTGLPRAKFLRPVHPGDVVEVRADAGRFWCSVGGTDVLTGVFTLA